MNGIKRWTKCPLFFSILNRSAVYDKFAFDEYGFWPDDGEFRVNGENAVGCYLAYETGNFVISFLSDPCWECEEIKGDYCSLAKEETLDRPQQALVPNVSCENNTRSFLIKYKENIETVQFHTGEDILAGWDEWFPNLIFCRTAQKQLKDEDDPINVAQIAKRLSELQKYFSTLEGGFDKDCLNHATVESETTLKQFAAAHTFALPDGRQELFSWHLRFTGKYAGRIFFLPDPGKKRCYIAHIGRKLPTVRFH